MPRASSEGVRAGDEALAVQVEEGDPHADHAGDGKDEVLQRLHARRAAVGLLLEHEHGVSELLAGHERERRVARGEGQNHAEILGLIGDWEGRRGKGGAVPPKIRSLGFESFKITFF